LSARTVKQLVFALGWKNTPNITFHFRLDGLIDYFFVRSLFLSIRPSKNTQNSDIKISVSISIVQLVDRTQSESATKG